MEKRFNKQKWDGRKDFHPQKQYYTGKQEMRITPYKVLKRFHLGI